MKTITLVMALMMASIAHAQSISIEAGLNSQGTGTGKIGIERQGTWINTEINASMNTGRWNKVYGFQAGHVFELKCTSLRVAPGLFYHTSMMSKSSEACMKTIRPGGSLRWQRGMGTFSVGTDGETIQLKIGIALKFK